MAAELAFVPYPMLPKPHLTFTVPSLHDGLSIDCRLYHPSSLTDAAAATSLPSWQKRAAIVAHPYAPLGGCYDDPIVDIVAGTLLRLDFVVATFNFRGANGSAGRTSWTAKAERADYMSVVGFLAHYMHYLCPSGQPESVGHSQELTNTAEDVPSPIRIRPPTPTPPVVSSSESAAPPLLLLGGYSYGAMITTQLPSVETILDSFAAPECGCPAAEIRLRAQHLADMQNTLLARAREAAASDDRLTPKSPRRHVGLRVGGDEDNRKSHESRRSLSADLEEHLRHGVAELMAKTRRRSHRRTQSSQMVVEARSPDGAAADRLPSIPGRTAFRPAYLLVSPLQGIVTNLATMSLPSTVSNIPSRVWTRLSPKSGNGPTGDQPSAAVSAEAEGKLVQSPTLAIYGDKDGFVPVRKLRDWASRLEAVENSGFRAHEVSSANHFWAQGNTASTLREAVRAFGASLLEERDTIR